MNYKYRSMNNEINRRHFLKNLGLGAAATLTACSPSGRQDSNAAGGSGKTLGNMTMRMGLTDDSVSILGYGCMRWKMKNAPDGNGQIVDQEDVNHLVDYALEHGVNYFDTSPVYLQGQSEKALGKALHRHPRNSYLVATKLSNFSNSTFENSVLMYQKSREYLQVETIDYYLLHSISNADAYRKRFVENGMIDFLLKEKEAGHIRHLGFSFHGDKECFDYLMEQPYHWDFVQIQMNYVDWNHAGNDCNASYMYQQLAERNIPVVIMEPLLGGRLSNLPQHLVNKLLQREPEYTVASWAFRFAGTFPKVLTVLSGMTYMEHLQDNVFTFSPLEPLNDDELSFLEEVAGIYKQASIIPCNDCKYCMPCKYGIDIPSILMHYNKHINEGTLPANSQDPQYRKYRKAYLASYDKIIERERQADHCVGCSECVPHCPQHIRIPREIQRIDKFIETLKQDVL